MPFPTSLLWVVGAGELSVIFLTLLSGRKGSSRWRKGISWICMRERMRNAGRFERRRHAWPDVLLSRYGQGKGIVTWVRPVCWHLLVRQREGLSSASLGALHDAELEPALEMECSLWRRRCRRAVSRCAPAKPWQLIQSLQRWC